MTFSLLSMSFYLSSLLGSLRSLSRNAGNGKIQWSDWLNEEKIIVLHVRHALSYNTLTYSAKWQREISTVKVLTTTWTQNSKSFILDIYLNGASTSPLEVCPVNNKGCEEEAQNSHHFLNVYFQVTISLPLPSWLLKLPFKKRRRERQRRRYNHLIGWMRKNSRAARAARLLVFFHVVCQMTWNSHIWMFWPQRKPAAENLSFSAFTWKLFVPRKRKYTSFILYKVSNME